MFKINPIPAFNDNYIWMLGKADTNRVIVVDPGDATPVLQRLDENNLVLEAILITHHHHDHTGGVATLLRHYEVPVYGPENSPFQGISHPLASDDQIKLLSETIEVQSVPGHTLDHISYFIDGNKPQLLCGDTLFLAGCGRLFEGSAKQMLAAMEYFKSLPESTEVYCTHEYSISNLEFARAVEPDNKNVLNTLKNCKELRSGQMPTLPSNIGQEKNINPFMRTQFENVIRSAEAFKDSKLKTEVEVFAAIREWKNNF
ncbi:hydroxyacylglutathione hydrolase [Marinobacterium jannaschii]|uniref:hydroxyacylglutathione hydrolase n=1 Tax=Marinobacterium jannaschii TaxID=64970 RepID=UPI0004873368|nr:hydroxyacylglutathione hydrolase [Marinobacterium jannaschii]